MEIVKVSYRVWKVESDSGNIYSIYFDTFRNTWNCNCKGFRIYGTECKHIGFVKKEIVNDMVKISDLSGIEKDHLKGLIAAGYNKLSLVADAKSEDVAKASGVTATQAQKWIAEARYLIADQSIIFRSGEGMIKHKEETVKLISTGSSYLDSILGGGVSTDCTTLFTGGFGTGKTQICMQLAVNTVCNLRRKAVYLITEASTVPPERMLQMAVLGKGFIPKGYNAERLSSKVSGFGDVNITVDEAKEIMKNFKGIFNWGVESVNPWDSDFILVDPASLRTPEKIVKALEQTEKKIEEEKLDVGIICIDSFTSLLREAYAGRGSLSDRGKTLSSLSQVMQRLASVHNLAVVSTGQVYGNPDEQMSSKSIRKFGMKETPWGGEYFLHSWAYQISLSLIKGGLSTKEIWRAYTYDCPVPRRTANFYIRPEGIIDAPQET